LGVAMHGYRAIAASLLTLTYIVIWKCKIT
jgi:hypothetical protein